MISAHLALMLVGIIYGIFFVLVKLILSQHLLDQMELVLLRLGLAALVAVVIEVVFFRTRFENRLDFLKNLGLGLMGVFIVQWLMVASINLTTAFHAALIASTIPVLTLVFSMLLGHERFQIQKALGILVAFVGVAMLLFLRMTPTALPPYYLVGDAMMLLNAVMFSLFLIHAKPMLHKYRAFSLLTYWYAISAIGFLGVFLSTGLLGMRSINADLSLLFVQAMAPETWIMVGFIVLAASLGTYALNNFALKRVMPSTVALYIFIQPLLAAILSIWVLQEPFTIEMGLSGLVIISGVIISSRVPPTPQQTSAA